MRASRYFYVVCGGSILVAIWAAMLWPEIGASIGCGVLAFLAHLQALRSIRLTCPANEEPSTHTCAGCLARCGTNREGAGAHRRRKRLHV